MAGQNINTSAKGAEMGVKGEKKGLLSQEEHQGLFWDSCHSSGCQVGYVSAPACSPLAQGLPLVSDLQRNSKLVTARRSLGKV